MANHPAAAHIHQIQNQYLSFRVSNNPIFVEYHFTQQRSQKSNHDTIIAFTISSLLGFLQIQTARKLNPITATLFVIGMLGYHLAFRAKFRFPTFASLFTILTVVFGSFSVASLVSLLLPDSWWPLKCIVYILLELCECDFHLYQIIRTLLDEGFGGRFCRPPPPRYMTATWPLLPQTYMDLAYHGNHRRHGSLSQRRIRLSSN